MATLDFGTVYDALAVQGQLMLQNVLVRGLAPREAPLQTRARIHLRPCILWPSIVVMPDARVRGPPCRRPPAR